MTLIVCLDDKNGMMFGTKRQSRDSVLTERILKITEGKKLILSPYSASLFEGKQELITADDPAAIASDEDFLFVENTALPQAGFDTLLIYRWNRRYPSTRFFTLSTEGFELAERVDFTGSSHDCITEERWVLK